MPLHGDAHDHILHELYLVEQPSAYMYITYVHAYIHIQYIWWLAIDSMNGLAYIERISIYSIPIHCQ